MSLASVFRPRSFLKRSFSVRALCLMRAALGRSEGAEILEFAISLPLLLVVAVGIFDFGSAFTVKQKVGNIALQGARLASNQPTTDLSLAASCGGAPASICSLRDVVENNLIASRLNDCGLAAANAAAGTPSLPGPPPTPANPGAPLTWNFVANGCPGNLYLTIERGFTYTVPTLSPPFQAGIYTIEGTRVTLVYPYQWQFGRVIPLIAPGANYLPAHITSVAIMQNLN